MGKKRVKKLVKSKKRPTKGLTKIFAPPGVKPSEYSYEELLELKRYYYHKLGQHLLYPEFEEGCPECGLLDSHHEFCSHL